MLVVFTSVNSDLISYTFKNFYLDRTIFLIYGGCSVTVSAEVCGASGAGSIPVFRPQAMQAINAGENKMESEAKAQESAGRIHFL